MKITVTKDNVKIEEFDVVHEGEHRVNKCSFSFSEEYTEELVKKAIFTSQNSSVEVAIINNECDIPTEILKARNIVLLGVYAYKVVDDKLDLRYSPSPDAFKVNSGSYIEGASESEEITPSQFEQYMQALNDGLNKVEESLKKMDEATSSATQLVDKIEQKLENGEFIGPEGPQGPQGVPGKNGTDGADGADGVGITTITSGQSTIEQDKTITPVTVQKSDGSSQIFKVEAKNGIDGQNGINGQDGKDGKDGVNGQDGLTPTIGENGNWFIGDTDTGKPSRGEVGPTPDLSDYVKNTDYASYSKGGVIKTDAYSVETDSNGFLRGKILTKEQFVATGNSDIISKGTMENIKDDYVESSNPVITLNNTLDNLVRKNRVSDYIVSLKDALKYKVFEFLVHGKVKQETTTGKNLLNYLNVKQFVSGGLLSIINNDGSITTTGTPTTKYVPILESINITDMLEDGQTYTIMQKNATNKLYIQVTITTNSDEISYIGLNNNTENIKTFTVDKQNNKKYSINIQSNIIETTGELNITNYYQLLKGSYDEWQPFEKYTGGQPTPDPDYPQEITTLTFDKITRRGKNLYDYNDKYIVDSRYTVDDDGWISIDIDTIDDSKIRYFNYYTNITRSIKPDTNYLLAIEIKEVSGSGYIYFMSNYYQNNSQFDGNVQNYLSDLTSNSIILKKIKSLKTFENSNTFLRTYLQLSPNQTGSITFRISILEDTTVTPENFVYEPYQATEYAIDLQGNEMVELPNGVKDELVVDKYGNVSLVKNIGKVVYDGINKKVFVKHSSFLSDTKGFYLCTIDNKNKNFDSGYTKAIKCDSLIARSGNAQTAFNNYDSGIWWEGNTNNVYMILSLTTIDEVNNWLQEHNVTFYYQLENPEVIPLGKLTNLITTEEGINNFFINGNLETTLEVLYALDIKKYIDNKLAEISSALIEEG